MPMNHNQANLPPEERQRRKAKYTNLLILLAIMIVVTVVTLVRGETAVSFDWSDTRVQITDPGGTSFTVVYADVTSLELVEHPDYGNCISGKKTASWIYGAWENDVWGTYTLCASAGTDLCIVMQTQQGAVVISYESDEITSALFDSMRELIP